MEISNTVGNVLSNSQPANTAELSVSCEEGAIPSPRQTNNERAISSIEHKVQTLKISDEEKDLLTTKEQVLEGKVSNECKVPESDQAEKFGAPSVSKNGPVPNFIIGSNKDAAAVSVTLPVLRNGSDLTSSLNQDEINKESDKSPSLASVDESTQNMGASSLSRGTSEELGLSLVSWSSEPANKSFDPSLACCSRIHIQPTAVPSGAIEESDKSDEKENTTPDNTSFQLNSQQHHESKATTSASGHQKSQSQSLKMSKGPTLRKASPANGRGDWSEKYKRFSPYEESGHNHTVGKIECDRCIRRSKSGNSTPSVQSRNIRRRVITNKSVLEELRTPIRSILKPDSRTSSGSEKQSSMDSLTSNSGYRNGNLMTKSDFVPRTKFDLNSRETASSLKNIEKYATLRGKRFRATPASLGTVFQSITNGKAPTAVSLGGPTTPTELMTKSLSFVEKSTPTNSNRTTGNKSSDQAAATSPLQRQGSLRLRKPSPGWEPSATRSSILRIQKIQESKAKNSASHQAQQIGSSTHSGSGDSLHAQHHGPVLTTTPVRPVSHDTRHNGTKVFAKLASDVGQTASSAQKRLRQNKKTQTESPAVERASHSQLTPDRVSGEHEDCKYKQMYLQIKAEKTKLLEENVSLHESLSEIKQQMTSMQAEHESIITFMEDEKSSMIEALSETESQGPLRCCCVEMKKNQEKELNSRLSGLVRQNEQLRQEAKTKDALYNKWEKDMISKVIVQDNQMSHISSLINHTLYRVNKCSQYLVKAYKLTDEKINQVTEAAQIESRIPGIYPYGCILEPLIRELERAFVRIKTIDPDLAKMAKRKSSVLNSQSPLVNLPIIITDEEYRQGRLSPFSIPANNIPAQTPTNGHSQDLSLDNLKSAIQQRDEAERLELESSDDTKAIVLPVALDVNELEKAMSRLMVLIRMVISSCDDQVKQMSTCLIRTMLEECFGKSETFDKEDFVSTLIQRFTTGNPETDRDKDLTFLLQVLSAWSLNHFGQ